MRPTKRGGDRRGRTRGVEGIQTVLGVSLENASEGGQMPRRMFAPAILRGVEDSGRDRATAEGAVAPDIAPYPPGGRLAFGQDRHGAVVAIQPLRRQDMRLGTGNWTVPE
jgi:hypothetical protein